MQQDRSAPHYAPNALSADRFPPELDFDYNRNSNLDLVNFTDAELARHFFDWRKAESRTGSAQSFREHFLPLISQVTDTLEIGPFCGPQLRGSHVRYFDIADREGLIEKAVEL
jgi:hypothetical protein